MESATPGPSSGLHGYVMSRTIYLEDRDQAILINWEKNARLNGTTYERCGCQTIVA